MLKELWNEPRPPDARSPHWQDWVLVLIIAGAIIVETATRSDIVWQTVVIALVIALFTPWRRTHPLHVVLLAFGSSTLFHLAALLLNTPWVSLNASIFVLVLPYSLIRWGTGRACVIGLAMIAFTLAVSLPSEDLSLAEKIGASLFLMFPAALGASVRYRDRATRRTVEQVRLREREQLARELHDTVAHHMSVIAIHAQAGQSLANTNPEASINSLSVIEQSASRALKEMRGLVHALRDDVKASRSPLPSIKDIEQLKQTHAASVNVNVVSTGDLDNLSATLQGTLYRLAQESVTNAIRHAQDAKNVNINIAGEAHRVLLRAVDDGKRITVKPPAGLGIRGMSERVALLGGTLTEGPSETSGWIVEATLPKNIGEL